MKIKKLLAVFAAVTMLAAAFTACNKGEDSSSEGQESNTEETSAAGSAEEVKPDPEEMTIKWLSYYDINPQGGNDRSLALTLFEDKFGGTVQWIPTTNDKKYDDLSRMVLGGEEVDMFPYEPDAVPKGVSEGLYQSLDDYIDLDSELWSGMKETADKLKYNGKYYVVPYSITDPICIIYSRKMMKDEKLDDPYTLYEQGKWDWDAFTSMMDKFIENGDGRYGCTGWLGQALVQSTGKTIVSYDGTKLTNNINDPDIEKAELMMEEMAASGTFNDSWQTYFPDSGSTLFYAMTPDALNESNGLNPDGDIFIVPFPKMPGADKYYTSCSFGAKMLVAGSKKGDAVAKYIECERMAAADEEYSEALKKLALTPVTDVNGKKIRFITEEQYDAIREISNPANVSPVVDFGFGMGAEMNGFSINYDSRGAMRNITDGLISGFDGSPSSWEELRDSYAEVIDAQISKYN